MRDAGRITSWNDDKGYGFVVPHDGVERIFVHINAFQSGSRRPTVGDLVSYATAKDARGRSNAVGVRFAGQRIASRRSRHRSDNTRPFPRALFGGIALAVIAIATMAGSLPLLMAVAYVLLSGLSYLTYGFDKTAAQANRQRVPEQSLHGVDLLGGWPGALIAQQRFRHKTSKTAFQLAFWFTVLANVGGVIWLLRSGLAKALSDAVIGIQ